MRFEQEPHITQFESFDDRELQNVYEFHEAISSVDRISSHEVRVDLSGDTLESETPVDQAIRRFRVYGNTGTLYLEDAYLSDGLKVTDFVPLISRGGKRSYHGVFFGNLHFSNGQEVPVAVKPHIDRGEAVNSCLSEYYNNEAISKLNFPNLQPVGFVALSNDRAYSFTYLDEALSTIDSIDWSSFYPATSEHPGMQEIWRQISEQAAFMHENGSISHGDFAARNIATTIDGGVMFIDWERARISTAEPRDAEVRFTHSHSDLATLLESMCRPTHDRFKAGIGIFYGKELDWWQGFKEVFFDRYRTTRLELLEQSKRSRQLKLDVLEELEVLEQSLFSHMTMMREICNSIPPKEA